MDLKYKHAQVSRRRIVEENQHQGRHVGYQEKGYGAKHGRDPHVDLG